MGDLVNKGVTQRLRCQTGAITAESALALTAVMLLTLVLCAALSAQWRYVRVVDAAGGAARLAARGESPHEVEGFAKRALGDRARVTVSNTAAHTTVQVSHPAIAFLGAVLPELSATAVAATEQP